MRSLYPLLLLLVLVAGCQDAAARQRAEQARTAAPAAKLKKLGNDLHANQAKNSTANTTATEDRPKEQ